MRPTAALIASHLPLLLLLAARTAARETVVDRLLPLQCRIVVQRVAVADA
jgi:hypothetical protein